MFGKSDQSKFKKAEKGILRGIRILEDLELKALYAQGYHYLGEVYADMGRKGKASETMKKVENQFRVMGMKFWLAKTQKILQSLES